jgi:hypothetical protein
VAERAVILQTCGILPILSVLFAPFSLDACGKSNGKA